VASGGVVCIMHAVPLTLRHLQRLQLAAIQLMNLAFGIRSMDPIRSAALFFMPGSSAPVKVEGYAPTLSR
jgi:hypothetical protein